MRSVADHDIKPHYAISSHTICEIGILHFVYDLIKTTVNYRSHIIFHARNICKMNVCAAFADISFMFIEKILIVAISDMMHCVLVPYF